uniref:Protein NRDE2 homolog n=1 Tax=Hirondellea gigas TaxID=1518452 RepID=A0A6A7FS99_9CRUS
MSLFPAYPSAAGTDGVGGEDAEILSTAAMAGQDHQSPNIATGHELPAASELNADDRLSTKERDLQQELDLLSSGQESDDAGDAQSLPQQTEEPSKPKHKKDKSAKKHKKKKKKKKKGKRHSSSEKAPSGEKNSSCSRSPKSGVRSSSSLRSSDIGSQTHKVKKLSPFRERSQSPRRDTKQAEEIRKSRSKSLDSRCNRSRSPNSRTERSGSRNSRCKEKGSDVERRDMKSQEPRNRSYSREDSKGREPSSRGKSSSKSHSTKRSRSHDGKQRSKTPDKKHRKSRSPVRQRRSISRDRKRRTSRSSEIHHKRSRSPYRKRRKSRSPERRHGSRANERKRTRSRSLSRTHRRSRSPARKHRRSRSPVRKHRRSRSLDRTHRSKSSDRKYRRSKSPARKHRRSKSPSSRHRSSRSPHKKRRRSRSRSSSKKKSSGRSKRSHGSRDASSQQNNKLIVGASKSGGVFVELGSYALPASVIYVDVVGDKNNFAFAVTHYTQLTRYKAMKPTMGDTTIVKKPKKKTIRYFEKKSRGQLLQNAELCLPLHKVIGDTLDPDYIPASLTYAETLKVSNNNKKKKQAKDKCKKTAFYLDSVDISEMNAPATTDETEYDYWLKLSKDFNEKLSKDTKNVQLWLEFVSFQNRAFVHLFKGNDGKTSKSKPGKSVRALADRKISLLDGGIKSNPHSVELQLHRLGVGEQLWELEQLNREWATLVYNFPNNMMVWHRYVEHHATCSLQFRVVSAVTASSSCCEKLRLMATGVFATHSPPPHPGLCCVDIVVQVCRLWAGSGYRERAVALFQAMLEFNLFQPELPDDVPLQDKLALLEQFWDSRAPRLGEAGNIGWADALCSRQTAQYTDQILEGKFDEEDQIIEAAVAKHPVLAKKAPRTADEAESSDDEAGSNEAGGEGTKTMQELLAAKKQREEEAKLAEQQRQEYDACFSALWLQLESHRESKYWLPDAADPDDCEDPDRMVTFDVLSPLIVQLPLAGKQEPETSSFNTRITRKWHTDQNYEKFYLLMTFLEFLGVDITEIEKRLFEYLQIDDYDSKYFDGLRLETLKDLFDSDMLSVCSNYTKILGLLSTIGPSLNDVTCDSYFQFVCNVLERTMSCFDFEYSGYLAVLYIKIMIDRYKAFQRNNSESSKLKKLEKTYKKSAKSLLKREVFRSNLLVYREYGALEECLGNFVEAEKVYFTALVLGSKDIDVFECEADTFSNVSSVCLSYVRLHLTAATLYSDGDVSVHYNSVLSLLCALANHGRVTSTDTAAPAPATLLRTRKKLAELLELALLTFLKSKKLTQSNNRLITIICIFLALLQFFTSGFKSCCLIFEETISRIENNDCSIVKKFMSSSSTEDDAHLNGNLPDDGHHILNDNKISISSQYELPRASAALLQSLQEQYMWLCTVLPRLPHLQLSSGSHTMPPIQYRGNNNASGLSPSEQRIIVQRALHTSPQSSFILALHASIQNWRTVLNGVGSKDASIKELLFRVLPHLHTASNILLQQATDDSSSSMGVSHTVLSVLRSAVQRTAGQHCPLLWRLYLYWARLTKRNIKSVIDTALTNCPASKAVYLSAVEASRGSALRSTVQLMEERGLRCRLPLQELELLLQEELENPEHNI